MIGCDGTAWIGQSIEVAPQQVYKSPGFKTSNVHDFLPKKAGSYVVHPP
jgi:hypothetical protein